MRVTSINYVNFRNLKDGTLIFEKRYNVFYGKNGQGKTSLLEGLYFAIAGRSFRTSKNSDLIKYGTPRCGSYVEYEDTISSKSLSVKLFNKKKIYGYNKKNVSYSEFHGKGNVVSFIPEDIILITGTPSVRRGFFDYEIAQGNYEYFDNLKDYNKLLKVRNKYIKERKTREEVFKVYEEQFVEKGALILKKRQEYVKDISRLLTLNYRKLFDDQKELSLEYKSFLGDISTFTLEDIKEGIRKEIEKQRVKEGRYGYSMVGPQKDDYTFLLNENEAKSFASQGEKKSIIFSLKLSEIDMILKEKKEAPIFIIDDISSYFDAIRKESIIKYFSRRDIQLFISSTSKLDIKGRSFLISDGEVFEEETS